jgi:2'-5' RNA ligase
VTLGRARHDAVDLRGLIADAVAPIGELVIDRVDLMRSHLGRGPAQYEQLASMPVGAPVHV